MEEKYFEEIGYLEYIEPEEFYAGDWTPVEQAEDEEGTVWDIVYSLRDQEYRYGAI